MDLSIESNYQGVVAGIDEAGRGPLAGPVVAAAVIIDQNNLIEGIKDSKKLSKNKREELYVKITQNYLWSIGVVGPKEIDEINILEATKKACVLAVEGLIKEPSAVIVDGNMKFSDKRFVGYIKGDDSAFTSFYAEVSKLLPQSIEYEPLIRLPDHNSSEHFINLSYMCALQKVLSSKVDSFEAGLKMLHNILLVFEEFASGDKKVQLKKYIQEYGYALKQQVDYLKLFSQLCDKEMPEFFEMLKDTIIECKGKIDFDFERAIKSMVIEPDQGISYYETAVKYLDDSQAPYRDAPECTKNKAKACYYLGLLS